MTDPIRRVLIANRGAIATRVQRTLRRMGIESVAVFAEADRASLHVAGADRAMSLGEGGARETYLDAQRLLEVARCCGADAIHPGYGFLSENAAFAAAVEDAGIRFLGPTAAQIEAFGLKHEARRLATEAAVPLLTGSGLLDSLDDALAVAERIGWPVMLKSSAGGGGIGMRACRTPDALRAAYEAVAAQAASSFGDDRLFLERFVEAARHVEVQVFGDGEGGVVVLGDRDCSMQRRNQKIIEEAPAPALPDAVRTAMHEAARRLMARVAYRSAGTVEFLYDRDREDFHFLEVNARLQVEHGVTEMVTGVDLVEWMVRLGQGERDFMQEPATRGSAIQVRLYAEDPAREFRPAPGLVTSLALPEGDEDLRIDAWLEAGVTVPAAFDPMVAKIIARGVDREGARTRLLQALDGARVDGVETNLAFLRAALSLPDFVAARQTTGSTAAVTLSVPSLEVLAPGTLTSVQDVAGRLGYWHVGVPPSGAFDTRALARANALAGNADSAAGLEMLARGPLLRFATSARVALCGARTEATLDGVEVPHDEAFEVEAGQSLDVGRIAGDGVGLRAYLAVSGGLDVPEVLGSRSTFDLGMFGGHAGRHLRTGDVLPLGEETEGTPGVVPPAEDLSERSVLRVVQGPHIAPDFLTEGYLDHFYASEWTVHYNSSRTGVRLEGPRPEWARPDGGDAGLHPSNVHDNAYAFGAIDFTGDMPIILGPDGPSLGGFVCPAAIAEVDRWKLGQLRPGDRIRFQPIDLEEARAQLKSRDAPAPPLRSWRASQGEVVLERDARHDVVLRAAGDGFLLLEFGPPLLELASRLRVEALQRWLEARADPDILELTPGVRSLQFRVPVGADRARLLRLVTDGLDALGDARDIAIPGRIVHLPLAWDDPATQDATARYMQSVRADAPWCPRNIEFIRRVNGLEDEAEVKRIVYDASYLVLGLGDVYLGAPVATPIDPRHRLGTTKYNPARTWTPENAVGIGGAYLCIYGMEGPGGYQFVGRTVQVWNRYRTDGAFERPWLLRGFDQLRFFEVSNEELLEMRRDFPLGRVPLKIETTEFRLADHEAFLAREAESIDRFRTRQQAAFDAERQRWAEQGYDPTSTPAPPAAEALAEDDGGTPVESPVTGSVWKVLIETGAAVEVGDLVMIIESMKTEIAVVAPAAGRLARILAVAGTPVEAGQAIALIDAEAS
ncbi:MAG: urea carboxylase [Pseudomonadales bacterium]|jgi:urea carboxylase|nr:urea carboxylase [Pseudomonadales bacterium]